LRDKQRVKEGEGKVLDTLRTEGQKKAKGRKKRPKSFNGSWVKK